MQRSENTERVSQRAVCNNPTRLASLGHECRSRRKKNASTATSCNTFDFLNTTFEELGMNDSTLLKYGINCVGSFNRLLEGSSQFFSHYGKSVDFTPSVDSSYCDNFISLIKHIEEKAIEVGCEFAAVSHDQYDDDCSGLDFVMYRKESALEDVAVILYASPALYMSEKGGSLYRKFIKLASDSMGVTIGASTDNYHLDMIMEMCIEESEADPDEELYVGSAEMGRIVNEYRYGGSFKELFDEIDALPSIAPTALLKELKEYRKICPDGESELIGCMIDGVPLVSRINVAAYDFNPEGYDDSESWLSSPLTTAILYSRNDHIADAMIDNINDELNSGAICYPWTRVLFISEKLKEESVKEFDDDYKLLPLFRDWVCKFFDVTEKFDNYGK